MGLGGGGHALSEVWGGPQGLTEMQRRRGWYLHDGRLDTRRFTFSVAGEAIQGDLRGHRVAYDGAFAHTVLLS